VYYISLKISK